MYAPSQFQCIVISHWVGECTEWSLVILWPFKHRGHFTDSFSIIIQMWLKFNFAFMQILSPHYKILHTWSCNVMCKNFVMIWWLRWLTQKNPLNFNYNGKLLLNQAPCPIHIHHPYLFITISTVAIDALLLKHQAIRTNSSITGPGHQQAQYWLSI